MKIVCISDTHMRHQDVDLPEGDMIIFAGDCASYGNESEVLEFINWFSKTKFEYKIMIAGNHDWYFEKIALDNVMNPKFKTLEQIIPDGVIYLNDQMVEIQGIKIWGSPIQPEFFNWAFNRERGEEIRKHWDLIPSDLDILITHGPPYGILDKNNNGKFCGCEDLLNTVVIKKPKFHVFGHIHEGYGIFSSDDTTYINAALLDEMYRLKNDPIIFVI